MAGWCTTIDTVATAVQLRFAVDASRALSQGVKERLADLICRAADPPRRRRPTRPTAGSVERRHRAKLRQGKVKALRGRVRDERD